MVNSQIVDSKYENLRGDFPVDAMAPSPSIAVATVPIGMTSCLLFQLEMCRNLDRFGFVPPQTPGSSTVEIGLFQQRCLVHSVVLVHTRFVPVGP